MDLMTLLAHVTLDTTEYEKAIDEAQKKAEGLSIQENYSLNLDNQDFMTNIGEAESEADSFEGPGEQDLTLDTNDFSKGLEDAQGDAETFQGNLDAVWEGIKTGLVAAGISLAIKGIFDTLSDCVNLAAQLGDNVDKGSKRLNISAEAYQEWSHVLDQSGANINDLQRGILSINKLLGGGEVAKSAAEAFEKLGVSTTTAGGGLKTTEQYLEDTIKALADFNGTSEERGALVEAIFGRNGNQLNAMFDEGSTGIEGLIKEAHELKLVMTDEEVANSAAYSDAVANAQNAIEALKTSLVSDILPGLTSVMDTIAHIVAFFNGRSSGTSLSDQFKGTDKELAKDLITIEGTADAAMDLVDKLFAMGDAEKLTAEQQAEWKQTAQWLVDNIPSLSGVIDTDTGSINANKEAITANIAEWKKLSTERAIAAAKEAKYQAMLEANSEAIDKQAQARAKANDATQKQYERIAEVNNLLRDNQGLADMFGAAFGTTTVTKDAANLQQMLDWMSEVGYEFANTQTFQELTEEYNKLANEQKSLQDEASKYDAQLADAQSQYESWCAAVEELYGNEETAAEGATLSANALKDALDAIPDQKTITLNIEDNRGYPHSHAAGAWSIPYDDYPALLHRGEMVLTASQARGYRNGNGSGGGIDMNSLKSAMMDAVVTGMGKVNIELGLDGQAISNRVSRDMARSLKARRFRG